MPAPGNSTIEILGVIAELRAEGFGDEDGYDYGEMARVAAAWALRAVALTLPEDSVLRGTLDHRSRLLVPPGFAMIPDELPRQMLLVVGALIVAEIERLDRRGSG